MTNEEMLNVIVASVFEKNTTQEALQYFSEREELIGIISLPDCIKILYKEQLTTDFSWKQLDEFIPPSTHIYKLILRDLLDSGYIVSCFDEKTHLRDTLCSKIPTAKEVFEISFLLVEQGMLCIASEFFVTAYNCISGIQEEWDNLKNDSTPNLRSYIEKFADKDINLDFMKGIME